MWGITDATVTGSDLCMFAAGFDLQCLREASKLSGLYLYDRPAIIFLTLEDVSSYAVVQNANATSIVLDVLGQEHVIPAGSLGDAWDGRFLVLWKRPQGVGNYLRESYSAQPARASAEDMIRFPGHREIEKR